MMERLRSRRVGRRSPAKVPDVISEVRSRLAHLVAADDRSADALADLRAMLGSVPMTARGRRWRQTAVLVNVHFRLRPKAVLRQMRRVRDAMLAEGRGRQYDAFSAEVQALLGDLTLSPHGYFPRLGSLDAEHVWGNLARVGARLDQAGLPWFLASGTLLGITRSGGLLPHDDDTDLCVLVPVDDSLSVEAACAAAARAWAQVRYELADLTDPEAARYWQGKVRTAGLPTVDLFPAWVCQGRLFAWPWSYGDASVSALLPLRTRELAGYPLSIPADPEALLTVNYGPDWRTPDPLFTFGWRTARERFAAFVAAMEACDGPW